MGHSYAVKHKKELQVNPELALFCLAVSWFQILTFILYLWTGGVHIYHHDNQAKYISWWRLCDMFESPKIQLLWNLELGFLSIYYFQGED